MLDATFDCPFCKRIARSQFAEERHNVVRFKPLNPVVAGHTLFVPRRHFGHAAVNPDDAANAFRFAAEWIAELAIDANIITSIGKAAMQTVKHTHIHVVPRAEDDGLHLPWTGQVEVGICGAVPAKNWVHNPVTGLLKCELKAGHGREHRCDGWVWIS